MPPVRNTTASRIGCYSAALTAFLLFAYAVTLLLGFLASTSSEEPISGPLFTILELLIILMMPAMVIMMTAVNARAPSGLKIFSRISIVFMALLCTVTSGVHFLILTLGSHPAFSGQPWSTLVFAFTWPSVAYALDILAWDFFFPISVLFAAPTFRGKGLTGWIRRLLIVSGSLALAGMAGVVTGNMHIRDIGVAGYVGIFLIVSVLLAVLFYREKELKTDASGNTDL